MAEQPRPQEPVRPLLNIKPPVGVAVLLGIGLGIHFAFTARIFPEGWVQLAVGLPVIALGLAIGFTAQLTFHRAGTDDRFARPPSTVVRHGLFSRSRNPMYVSLVLVFLGIVLSVNAAWALVMLPVVVAYLQFGVIKREERYLERWFGNEYLDYKSRVRRWI